jgi:choice-of-anchor B domain-containing protein
VQSFRRLTSSRRAAVALAAALIVLPFDPAVRAADVFLGNIDLVAPLTPADEAQTNPAPHAGSFQYGDIWGEGIYAYMGSDRPGGGVYIFDVSDPTHPDYISTYFPADLDGGLPPGGELEDVEVYNGIAYVGSDVDDSDLDDYQRTGVDVVDVTNPFAPSLMKRISTATGYPQAHDKVHTLSINNGFLYTSDNQTPTVKIFNVSNPANPQYVSTIDLTTLTPENNDLTGIYDTHEVMARNGKLFVATKNPNSSPARGWTHIFDVSNVATTGPVLLKEFETGHRTHTSSISQDGTLMVVAQERTNGLVQLFDVSNPATPVLKSTLTRPAADAHSPHHPHIHNDLLFIAWYEAGLQVYNILDPANPVLIGAYDTYPGTSTNFNGNWGVFPFLGYDKVLLSDRDRGLIILDVTGLPAPTPDFNFDTNVNGLDFLAWQNGYGTLSGATPAIGDGNRDGKVDAADLAYWRANFGETGHQHATPAAAAVPEASTLALALVAAAGSFRRGVRQRSGSYS